jgi:CarD family transcriptional regulator
MATKSHEPVIGDGSLHIGDRVVYPNQGICRITGVETKQIAGQNWEVVTLSREEDGATVMVPKGKVMGIGLRKVADVAAIDRVFDELATPNTDPQLDWKVRHRENADRMTGGGLFGTVEVLKGLHALSRVRPLPQKERELYDNARHLLVGEIAAAMNIPLHVAEDNLDYALWPPPGMTRKGKPLPPATLGPPSPARPTAEDDDLGFEEEELGAAVEPVAPVAEETDEEEERPAAHEAAAEKEKSRPPHRPAKPAPVKKVKPALAKKAAPAKKAAGKKPAPASRKAAPKKPAGKTKAKGKR